MLSLKGVVLCFIVTSAVWYSVDSWSVGQIVGDLPLEIIEDILSILVWGTVIVTGNCTTSNDTSEVQYWLYTRNNPNDTIIIDSYDHIDASKPTIFLLHGWGGNANIDYIRAITDAYLKRYDCNIISVNYETYAAANYQTSYCHLPAIGRNVAQFICNMSSTLKINLSDLHIVGHSLGGQAAGFVGKSTQRMCGTLGRITALDPAGPLFQNVDQNGRLDKADATFVDVIHTNQAQFGYKGDCGDVDFYPDCGYHQPGCIEHLLDGNSTIDDILDLALSFIDCSHQRSCYLFAESINNNSFYSTSCRLCGTRFCFNEMVGETYAYMGESCRSKPEDNEYTLDTNDEPPYAQGPPGPLD